MNFKRWINITGLSESSAKKYSSAVFGSISEWAREAGLIDSSLIEISDPLEFEKLTEKITRLPIFIERNGKGNNMYSSALNKYYEYLKGASDELAEDIENIITDRSYVETDKIALIKTRIGQGEFRSGLLNYWRGCAVTGYKTPKLLIASHIKPWRDANDQERLDTYNGLLLTPNLDKAFDAGFISFDSKGSILISKLIENPFKIGIKIDMKANFKINHQKYLDYHRNSIFMNF